MSFVHRMIGPSNSDVNEIDVAGTPERFRGPQLFVRDGLHPQRGMFYSLLIHTAAITTVLALPAPKATDLLEAAALRIGAPDSIASGSDIPSAGIAWLVEGALRKGDPRASTGEKKLAAATRCCSPQTIISNPPNTTNYSQTILQPDFADRRRLKKIIPLPNMARLAPLLLGPGDLVGKLRASPAKPLELDVELIKTVTVLPDSGVPVLPVPRAEPPPAASASPEPNGPQRPQAPVGGGSGGGDDAHDTLVLSVVPAMPDDVTPIPVGESRGKFAATTAPNPADSHLESDSSRTPISENGPGAPPAPENRAADTLAKSTETLSTATETPDKNPLSSSDDAVRDESVHPGNLEHADHNEVSERAGWAFPGITIQGGEGSRDWRPARRVAGDVHPHEPARFSYALTVASTGNSGGGLRDFGVFGNESVFTDYLDMSSQGLPAPPWVLQYAFTQPCCGPQVALTPPLPATEMMPRWPEDLVSGHMGEMVVVYVVIAQDGKLQDARVMQSSCSDLSDELLDVLKKWTFRPAAINSQPASVKALLGVSVVPYD